QWPFISFYLKEGNKFKLRASNQANKMHQENDMFQDILHHDMRKALSKKKIIKNIEISSNMRSLGFPEYHSSVTVPIIALREAKQGVIVVAGETYHFFSESDLEVLKLLADHISLALEGMLVNEKRQKMLVLEERNRLARDLHDSVNQKLFS